MNGMPMNNGMGGIPPVQPIQPAMPNQMTPGQPMVQQVPAAALPKKDYSGLIKTIVIIIVSLVAVAFIGLFIWMNMN